MAVYPLNNNSIVSVKELDEVLTICSSLGNQKVSIRFDQGVELIDIVFVGGLFLLYKQKGLTFYLTGICGPDYKSVFDPFNRNVHAFMQYLDQINDLYAPEEGWLDFYGKKDVATGKVGAASVYSPVLFIDEKNLECFFDAKSDDLGGYKEKYLNRLKNSHENDVEKEYFSKERNVAVDLKDRSAIETFVFSIMYSVKSPFVTPMQEKAKASKIKKGKKDKLWADTVTERAEKAISDMRLFAEQYVGGLKELAKNIVTHSQFKMGIITLRAYLDDSKEKNRNLETFVFDYGTIGIIPQMTQDLEKQTDKTDEDKEDLNLLSSKEFHLKDLMEQSDKLLFRQIHREMAHLGLIHFTSLIRSRDGRYSVSTQSFDGKREDYPKMEVSEGKTDGKRNMTHGTNFHFTLPLRREKGTLSKNDPTGENGMSQELIMALSEMLKTKDCIQMVPLLNIPIHSRDDEIRLVQSADIPQEGKMFYAVDFSGLEDISASSLLRVLALFSRKTDKNLIVYNIVTNTFCEMLNVNEEYFQRLKESKDVGYWIKGKSVLVYSHMVMPKLDLKHSSDLETDRQNEKEAKKLKEDEEINRFFFADLLFGQTADDFIGVNRAVSHVFPNFVSLSSFSDHPVNISLDEDKMAPVRPFFSGLVLMPFDIILEGFDGEQNTGYSIFFSNLDYLLNKSIDENI